MQPKAAALPLMDTSLVPRRRQEAASIASTRAVRSIAAPELPVVSVPLPTRRSVLRRRSSAMTSTSPRNDMLAGPNFTATVPL